MKNILKSLIIVVAVAAVAGVATYAVFSDTETSNGNSFAAGTLDLKIDGGDVNVSKTFSNMKPIASQPNFTYELKNDGTVDGYLNINVSSVASGEDGCTEPETAAGDGTCTPGSTGGELADVLNLRLMLDANCNGWYEASDTILFDGLAKNIETSYTFNKLIAPGSKVCVNTLINWWSTSDDNKAQGDNMTYNLSFGLTSSAL